MVGGTADITPPLCSTHCPRTPGALDLTTKTAYHAMTSIEKVFMLSTNQRLDDSTVESIMSSKPYSRLPIYRGDNKKDIVGWVGAREAAHLQGGSGVMGLDVDFEKDVWIQSLHLELLKRLHPISLPPAGLTC